MVQLDDFANPSASFRSMSLRREGKGAICDARCNTVMRLEAATLHSKLQPLQPQPRRPAPPQPPPLASPSLPATPKARRWPSRRRGCPASGSRPRVEGRRGGVAGLLGRSGGSSGLCLVSLRLSAASCRSSSAPSAPTQIEKRRTPRGFL